MTHEEQRIWLIEKLKKDSPSYRKLPIPKDEQGQKDLLRILMNVRMPKPISEEFRTIQNAYLRRESIVKGIVEAKRIPSCKADDRIAIWQGDITRLRADAITNAANSALLGCFQPLHSCIDNFIHTAAGIDLRLECAKIMEKQGHEEPSGQAKISLGYCLPAKYVIHTVGPIVPYGKLAEEHKMLLKSCYEACLKLADEKRVKSIAFCCISTGVFMFPAEEAAKIAVATVKEYLDARYDGVRSDSDNNGDADVYKGIEKIIFDVFSERDKAIYDRLLN